MTRKKLRELYETVNDRRTSINSFILVNMNLEKLRPNRYLSTIGIPNIFSTKRTKEILSVNPTVIPLRGGKGGRCFIYDYTQIHWKKSILPIYVHAWIIQNSGPAFHGSYRRLAKIETRQFAHTMTFHP